MSENLPNESTYRHLADLLRSGGRLEIGESLEFGSLARLRIGRTTLDVAKMNYSHLAEVLQEMENQARQYAERIR